MKMQKNVGNKIGIVSIGRSDFNYIAPIIIEFNKSKIIKPIVIVSGSHLFSEFGNSYTMFKKYNIKIDYKISMPLRNDSCQSIGKSIGQGIINFSDFLSKNKCDMIMVAGDRFETFAVAASTIPFNIPLIHIDGGDVTEGAVDDKIRHSITKLSHLHFTASKDSYDRVIQMGEEPWRVTHSGTPVYDFFKLVETYSKDQFYKKYNLLKNDKFFLITYHPVTLELNSLEYQLKNLYKALSDYLDYKFLVTYPNVDASNSKIINFWKKKKDENKNINFIINMGSKGYFSAMKYASAMIGNSSSGIYESSFWKLPTVNIGNRQKGRLFPESVLQSSYKYTDIKNKISMVLNKNTFKKIYNPYFKSGTCKKIRKIIEKNYLLDKMLLKKFHNIF